MQQPRLIDSKTTNNKKVTRGRRINYVKNIAIVQYDHNWVDKDGKLRLGAKFEEVYLKNLPKDNEGGRYAPNGKIVGYKYKRVREATKGEQLYDILTNDNTNLRNKVLNSKGNAGKLPKYVEPILISKLELNKLTLSENYLVQLLNKNKDKIKEKSNLSILVFDSKPYGISQKGKTFKGNVKKQLMKLNK